jgi:hypothetical protein
VRCDILEIEITITHGDPFVTYTTSEQGNWDIPDLHRQIRKEVALGGKLTKMDGDREVIEYIKRRGISEFIPSGQGFYTCMGEDEEIREILCTYCEHAANATINTQVQDLVVYKNPPHGAKDLKIRVDEGIKYIYRITGFLECSNCGAKLVIK